MAPTVDGNIKSVENNVQPYKNKTVVFKNKKKCEVNGDLSKNLSKNADLLTDILKQFSYIDFEQLLSNQQKAFEMLLQIRNYEDDIVSYLNAYRQNLLHTACQLNFSHLIAPLIELGCNPAKQDYDGRTPFHLALEYNHVECLEEFSQIMAKIGNGEMFAGKEVAIVERLKSMCQQYNRLGHTIVHQTVNANKPEVLKQLLLFCRQHKLDVLDREVLGCGDSLLHLAVRQHNTVAVKIIVEYFPESVEKPNYSGVLPYDLNAVTKDIKKIL